MLNNYEFYRAEDFLQDHWFRQWVAEGNPEAAEFWEVWLADHPGRREELVRARAIFLALERENHIPGPDEIESAIDDTVARINSIEPEKARWSQWYWKRWVSYAASIVLIAGLIVAGINLRDKSALATLPIVESGSMNWQKEVNRGTKPMIVRLRDGSKVILQPQAELTFPRQFEDKERRTFLVGNAFFEISRDTKRPFLVVTDKLVTKVLGTSFWVNAGKLDKSTSVIVRTGRVSVSRRDAVAVSGQRTNEIILTPNQRVDFSNDTEVLSKVLTEKPVVVYPEQLNQATVYEETPIIQVFEDLEERYGVKIVYDTELLKKCQLNATFGDEPFFEKLDLICQSIRASYKQNDGTIVIESKGCNY